MHVEKGKLPYGFSYGLNTKNLKNLMIEAEINIEVTVSYSHSKIFFDAQYVRPNRNVDHERILVRVGSVKSEDRRGAKQYVEHSVLPEFIEWVSGLVSLPKNSTKFSDHSFVYFRRDFVH